MRIVRIVMIAIIVIILMAVIVVMILIIVVIVMVPAIGSQTALFFVLAGFVLAGSVPALDNIYIYMFNIYVF